MSDTFLRQINMLRLIPRHPRKKSTQEIKAQLETLGFSIDLRSIQRDLDKLAGRYLPLTCDTRSKPYGWSWAQDADILDLPGMDTHTALTFRMARQFLAPLLPPVVLNHLEKHFDQANKILADIEDSGIGSWLRKIRVLSRTQTLIPATIDETVLYNIYEALLSRKQISATYQPKNSPAPKHYLLHPLGLVFRESVIYLLATAHENTDVKQFSLHRFHCVTLQEEASTTPDNFDLDRYIKQGNFDYLNSETELEMHALFDADTAIHLEETPLSAQQTLNRHGDGRVLLKALVKDTSQLRWWLLGFGANVEVLKPAALRQEIAEQLETALSRYK